MNNERNKYFYTVAFVLYFFGMFTGPYLFALPLLVISISKGIPLENMQEYMIVPMFLFYVFAIICYFLFIKKDKAPKRKIIVNIAITVIAVVLMYLGNVILEYIYQKLNVSPDPANQKEIENLLKGKMKIFAYPWIVIIAPFFEEILFRMLFLNTLKDAKCPRWLSFVLVALLFAAVHLQNLNDLKFFPLYFIPSLVLTAAYFLSKEDLKVSVFVHFLNNLLCLF